MIYIITNLNNLEAIDIKNGAITLFHEFGHALHELLSTVNHYTLSGTNVPADFLEFPSQLHERLLAEQLPLTDVQKKYFQSQKKQERIQCALPYFYSVLLDLAANMTDQSFDQTQQKLQAMFPHAITPYHHLHHFAHFFGSLGYASNYHVYFWAELYVLLVHSFADRPNFYASLESVLAAGNSIPCQLLLQEFLNRMGVSIKLEDMTDEMVATYVQTISF